MCIMLMSISIVFVGSLSFFVALRYDQSPYSFMFKQAAFCIVGLVLMFAISKLNPEKNGYKVILWCIFVISFFACLLLPLAPESISANVNGAKRWYRVGGISLAPIEFFKIGIVFFLSVSFPRRIKQSGEKMKESFKILLPYFIIMGLVTVFIYISQNDIGQCIVLLSLMCFLAILAGSSKKLMVLLGAFIICCLILVIMFHPTRAHRVLEWWAGAQNLILPVLPDFVANAFKVEYSTPYQINHSLNAIANGGLFGQGIGLGVFKLGFLSEVHTDFILSGIAEEIGVVGFVIIGTIYALLTINIFKVGAFLKDKRDYIFCSGIAYLIISSFLMNAFGIISVIPLKGIAVPLLSYGGSSMISMSMGIGFVLMLNKKSKQGE